MGVESGFKECYAMSKITIWLHRSSDLEAKDNWSQNQGKLKPQSTNLIKRKELNNKSLNNAQI